ncbi:MAG: sensor histidine kinase [Spirochaetota bacterium]
MKISIRNSSLRIAGIYAIAASIWIILSDRVLYFLAGDYAQLAAFQTFKGIFFVTATSILLFLYSRSQLSSVVSLQSRQRQDAIDALCEKEVLLREVHHRVKNNLQVIVSLLSLKDGAAACAGNVRDKVRSMALVHELLYGSMDLAAIDAADFVSGLGELMRSSYAGSIVEINTEGDHHPISASMAIPIGIFLVEACSNAVQHGRPGLASQGGALRIHLSLRLDGRTIVAGVKDNGRGFGSMILDGTGMASTLVPGGSGTALMDAVASQVSGSVYRSDEDGALIQLRCPAETFSHC